MVLLRDVKKIEITETTHFPTRIGSRDDRTMGLYSVLRTLSKLFPQGAVTLLAIKIPSTSFGTIPMITCHQLPTHQVLGQPCHGLRPR